MKNNLRKGMALLLAGVLVLTSMTFIGSNRLKAADEDAANQVEQTTVKSEDAETVQVETPEAVTSTETIDLSEASDAEDEADSAHAETAEPENKAAAEETKMPAQLFDQTADNGIRVLVTAPEGAFPAGTEMVLKAVSVRKAKNLVKDDVDNVRDAKGVDITFVCDGKEIEPAKDISVELRDANVKGTSFDVYHVEDNGNVEKISADSVNANGASFKADEFSVYIVIGQDEEITIPDALQLNVRFINNAGLDVHESDTKFFEERDEDGNYTINYTLPDIEGKTPESVEGDEGVTFTLADGKITASVTPIEQAEDAAEKVQQTVSCVVKYTAGRADYTVKHWFEKADATDETPDDQRYEQNLAEWPDEVFNAEIESGTNAAAKGVIGFQAQEINQDFVAADGSTIVNVYYNRNSYQLTYDTKGGSYIKGKGIKHGSNAVVYTETQGQAAYDELICTQEAHEHTASCYSPKVLNCEHTHDRSCYTSSGGTISSYSSNVTSETTHVKDANGFEVVSTGRVIKTYYVIIDDKYYWISSYRDSFSITLACKHQHNDSCYTGGDLICTKTAHAHSSGCYRHHDAIEASLDPTPTREGYTFAGWYLDEDYETEAPATIENVQSDTYVFAKWDPAMVNYTIVYFQENADGTYSYKEQVTKQAQTGSRVNGENKDYPEYDTLNNEKTDTNVEVKADGSSVVNMYYDRTKYTFTLKDGGKTVKTFTAKWGTNIRDEWIFTGSNGKKYPQENPVTTWKPSGSRTYTQRVWGLELMPQENITWTHTTTTNGKRTYEYYVETLGAGSKTWQGMKYDLYNSIKNDYNTTYYNDDFIDIDGYTQQKISVKKSGGTETAKDYSRGDSWNAAEGSTTNFYYTLNSYTITKDNDGTRLPVETYKYTQDISQAGAAPATKPEGKEDYTFGGWYDNAECNGDAFEFTTMPAQNLLLYAKWNKPVKTITIVFQNGDENISVTVPKGEKVSIETPAREGYNFTGWYTEPTGGEEYDINAPVTEDVTVYAQWSARPVVQYTVRYETANGDTVSAPYIGQAKAGSIVKATAVKAAGIYAGYYPDANTRTLTLNQDPTQNVIVFIYSDKSDFQYRVVYKYNDITIQEGQPVTVHTNQVRVIADSVPAGYKITGDQYKTAELGNGGVTDVIFQVIPKDYTIRYENITGASWVGETGCTHPTVYTCDTLVGSDIVVDAVQREGSLFLGWDFTAKNADGTPARIDGGHNNVNPVISDGTYGNLVFKAIWGQIVADDVEKTYDGEALGINTPSVQLPEGLTYKKLEYSRDGENWQDTIPEWTNAGTYTTYIRVVVNKYRNLRTTAQVKINPRTVTLESGSATKIYDGQPLTNDTVTVGGDGWAQGEGASFNVTGTRTEEGESSNTFTYTLNENTLEGNYNIIPIEGKLIVTGRDKVVVIIKEHSGEYDYDGTTKTVTGYDIESTSLPGYGAEGDFEFTGNDTVSGVKAGTYDMELKPEDFVNLNPSITDVTFVIRDGQLVIKKVETPIVITANSNRKKYDGQALVDAGFTYTQGVLREGDVLTAVISGSQTDAGSSTNKVVSWQVKRGSEDVTDSYTFGRPVNGTLEVTKRVVTMTSGTISRIYNGEYLTKEEVTVTGDGFIDGEGATYSDFARRLQRGSIDNTFRYALNEGTNEGNYDICKVNGTLTVLDLGTPVRIKALDGSKMYDGTPLANPGYTYDDILLPGDVLTATTAANTESGTITDVGNAKNVVVSYKIIRHTEEEGDVDVTHSYYYNGAICEEGDLEVTPRHVTLTSATVSKTYDGTPLTDSTITVGGDGFIEGQGYSADVTGSQTEVGSSDNTFTYTLNEGTRESNYSITTKEGTLTVSKKNGVTVTITEHSGEFEYDGTKKTVSGYDVSIPEGSGYTVNDFSFSGNDVIEGTYKGRYPMNLTADDFSNINPNFADVVFLIVDGEMVIKKVERAITITANSNSKPYDGTPLTDSGYSYTEGVLKNGDVLTADVSGTITDAGNVSNVVTSYKVMHGDTDVTGSYTFGESVPGTLTVTPRLVTLTSATDSKPYDGTPLTKYDVAVTGDGWAEGEGAVYQFSGSQLEAGTSDNSYEYAFAPGVNPNNYIVVKNTGTLTVSPVEDQIVITAASEAKKYDGRALTNSGYNYTQGVLKGGDVLTAVVSGTITDAGDVSNVVTSYKVMHGDTDVTGSYTFGESVQGTLTVKPREITLTSATDSKPYDGTPLTNSTIIETGDKFAEGEYFFVPDEGYTATVTGSQTIAGTSDNTFEYVLKSNTKAQNYKINIVQGTLTVEPIQSTITITANSDSKVYDGSALTNSGYTFTPGVLIGSDRLEAVVEGSQTNADSSANVVTSYVVMNGDTNVTGCYIFNDPVPGTLTVTPRPVTLTSATDSKVYDGSPLVNHTVTATEFSEEDKVGFVGNDGFTADVTGSQTEVGSSDNTFTYTLNEGTIAGNYDIDTVPGTLTVSKKGQVVVTITEHSDTVDYNGAEQSVTGYDVHISDPLYKEEYFTFTGNDSVSGTDVGEYDMALVEGDFQNANPNFDNVKFNIVDGKLKIKPISTPIVIKADDASKVYDGQPLTKDTYTYNEDVLVEGDVLTAVVEGTITNAGNTENVVTSYVVKRGDEDVTSNYTFGESVPGTLTVTPRPVTLTSATDSKPYDGTPLTNHDVAVTGYGWAEGEGATYNVTGTITNVGWVDNTFTYSLNEGTSADNYKITTVEQQLTITPLNGVTVRIKGHNDTVDYNGAEQSVTGYEVESISSDLYSEADFSFTGEAKASGTYACDTAYPMNLGSTQFANTNTNFAEVTFIITDGWLKIDPISTKIVVKAADDQKKYDGTPLTNSGYEMTSGTLASGDRVVADVEGLVTNVKDGPVANRITDVRIYHGEGDAAVDVTANYSNIEPHAGELKITPRTVTLTSGTASKVYDGTPLTDSTITVGGDGFIEGQGYSADVTGSRTDAGSSKNTFTYTLNEGTEESNYSITTEEGTLTVSKKNGVTVTITEHSGEFEYDGTKKTVRGYDVSIPEGSGYTENDFSFSGNDVIEGTYKGRYPMNLTADDFSNINQNFTDVVFLIVDGEMIITKRSGTIIVTADSDSKMYDGTPLTNDGFTYTEDVLADGDRLVVEINGTITDCVEGGTANTVGEIKVMRGDVDVTDNYDIGTPVDGKLEVTKRKVILTSEDESWTYDGTAHVKDSVNATGDGWATGEGAEYSNFAMITNVVDSGMKNTFDYTLTGKAQNYDITVVTGTLNVTPKTITVTIKGNEDEVKYDGKEHEITGYEVVISDEDKELYDESNVKYDGDAEAHGTFVDEYPMNIDDDKFSNDDPNFNVEFVVEDGKLVITPADPIIIDTDDASKMYDGEPLTEDGYEQTGGKLGENDRIEVTPTGTITDAGETENTAEIRIIHTDPETGKETDVTDCYDPSVVNPGTLKVTQRNVVIKTGDAEKLYDGKPLTNDVVTIGGDGFIKDEGITYRVIGSQTEVGSSENTLDWAFNEGTKSENYEVEVILGTLKVNENHIIPPGPTPTPDPPEVIKVVSDGDGGYTLTTVADGKTPLDNLTDYCCILHLLIMLAAWIVLMWYAKEMKDRQAEIFDLEEQLAQIGVIYR